MGTNNHIRTTRYVSMQHFQQLKLINKKLTLFFSHKFIDLFINSYIALNYSHYIPLTFQFLLQPHMSIGLLSASSVTFIRL